jgi:hypothetical protein
MWEIIETIIEYVFYAYGLIMIIYLYALTGHLLYLLITEIIPEKLKELINGYKDNPKFTIVLFSTIIISSTLFILSFITTNYIYMIVMCIFFIPSIFYIFYLLEKDSKKDKVK